MKKKKYKWDKSTNTYPVIDIHSIKKHDVIREYLRIYINVVGGHPYSKMLRLNLVDGFAGGGLYKRKDGKIHEGSPLLIIKTIEATAAELSIQKDFKLHSRYYFVEKDPGAAVFLKNLIRQRYKRRFNEDIFVFKETFQEKLISIIKDIKKRGRAHRTIFFLDQYGYSEISIKALNYIFNKLPKAEVILTFNVDSLIDYMTNSPECRKTLDNINLSYDLEKLTQKKKQKRWRENIQIALYQDFKSKIIADFLTNFFIKSSESSRSYWLLHLSMNSKAKDEMQKLHWEFKNHFVSETKTGLKVFPSYDPMLDFQYTRQYSMTFSDPDKVENKIKLLSEIPENLTYSEQRVKDFFLSHINDTPATQLMIYNAIQELYERGELEVKSKSGLKKRSGSSITDHDLVNIPKQLRIFKNFK